MVTNIDQEFIIALQHFTLYDNWPFFYIKYCHCITPKKLCLRVDLLLILWFHIHEGSVNISSVAFNVHLQYLTLNNKISWFALKRIEYAHSPDKYCSCFTWILVLIEPLHIFSVSSRKLQIILHVLTNVFEGLKISSLKAKIKIFFLVKESGDSNYPVTKKKLCANN